MSSISTESDYYKQLFDRYTDELNDQRKDLQEKDSARAKRMEENYINDLRKQEKESEAAMNNVREQARVTIADERDAHREELARVRENYDRMGRQFKQDGKDAGVLEKRLEQAYKDGEIRSTMAQDKLETAQTAMRDKLAENNREATSLTEQLRASHREESDRLRGEIKELRGIEGAESKRRGDAIAQSIRDNENDWLLKERRLIGESKAELDHLRNKARETESYYGQANAETLRKKDAYFADVLRRQAGEMHRDRAQLNDQFKTQLSDLEKQRKMENTRSEASSSARLASAHEQERIALEKQAAAYEELMARSRESQKTELDAARKALFEQRNTDDPGAISPLAEAVVRRNLIKEYEKQFDAEKSRHKAESDYMHKSATEKLQDTLWREENKMTERVRQDAAEKFRDRSNATAFINEIEYDKRATIALKDMENDRASTNMTRIYGASLERQRRDFETQMSTERGNALERLREVKQEADFNARMQQREAQMRNAETVREYEKKMADMRSELELKIDDLKTSRQNDLREAERNGRKSLEENTKQYEQRLAQLEAQHKERERYLQSTFQEEIDRVRRSNEIASRKKS